MVISLIKIGKTYYFVQDKPLSQQKHISGCLLRYYRLMSIIIGQGQ